MPCRQLSILKKRKEKNQKMKCEERGQIYLYTGEGDGKTLAALGLAIRTIGHEKSAVIIQFMKGRRSIGEYKIRKRLAPDYKIYQFGKEEFVDLENPDPKDFRLAKEGLEFAREILQTEPDLLVLDEINLAVSIGLISLEEVLSVIEAAPCKTSLVLTGRDAHPRLIETADLASRIEMIHHPFESGREAEEGLQY